MRLEDLSGDRLKALDADEFLGIPSRARSIPRVDVTVMVQEHRRPGQVVVELEEVDVDPVHPVDPQPDEVVRKKPDELLVPTSRLLVERFTIRSGVSAEEDQDRLPRASGLVEGRRRVAGPPAVSRLLRRPVRRRGRFQAGLRPWLWEVPAVFPRPA